MIIVDKSLALNLILWYIGNYYYNIQNKLASNACGIGFAMSIATTQLGIGVIYSLFLWFVPDGRRLPKTTMFDIVQMYPVGLCSAIAHVSSVFSLASGGVVFGQIVKASEPVFAAFIGTIFYNKPISIYRWICLSIIILGVSLASLKENEKGYYEIDFSIGALVGAVIANIFAAFKGAENKKIIETSQLIERIGSVSNQYAIMNIISFTLSVPIMLFVEGYKLVEFHQIVLNNNIASKNIILSGLTFYIYNELSTITLKKMSAVNQSVANTAKRVIIIISSTIIFNEKVTTLKGSGCLLCIGGVFVDSIIDDLVKNINKIK
jgi:solute carrier family 35 protein E1